MRRTRSEMAHVRDGVDVRDRACCIKMRSAGTRSGEMRAAARMPTAAGVSTAGGMARRLSLSRADSEGKCQNDRAATACKLPSGIRKVGF